MFRFRINDRESVAMSRPIITYTNVCAVDRNLTPKLSVHFAKVLCALTNSMAPSTS
jgi:hypothetical protein